MKKRILNAFGFALLMASPLWIMHEPADYRRFVACILIGIFLLVVARYFPEEKARTNR
ncbi:MAG: hypothetical protein ACE14M_03715 [Terriglobales bacterium]